MEGVLKMEEQLLTLQKDLEIQLLFVKERLEEIASHKVRLCNSENVSCDQLSIPPSIASADHIIEPDLRPLVTSLSRSPPEALATAIELLHTRKTQLDALLRRASFCSAKMRCIESEQKESAVLGMSDVALDLSRQLQKLVAMNSENCDLFHTYYEDVQNIRRHVKLCLSDSSSLDNIIKEYRSQYEPLMTSVDSLITSISDTIGIRPREHRAGSEASTTTTMSDDRPDTVSTPDLPVPSEVPVQKESCPTPEPSEVSATNSSRGRKVRLKDGIPTPSFKKTTMVGTRQVLSLFHHARQKSSPDELLYFGGSPMG
eukprot:CAMPEP_0184644226 /NCGR_PEP_ID=MMETSP0308-20130426/988_1 /TAXON_ID=38269 /ORGANISM="Gloeochaete witrockiana, Strain SAG 46.84" /LENGTH=314 /DNA_ID=CAMNT_0027072649 /DNA_START=68 /DNA_END=1012 /DNA_ORIENTATION=-